MKKRTLDLIYYPTFSFLLLSCILMWIDVPDYTKDKAVNAYWIVFACGFIFYGLFWISKHFLEDYDCVVGFTDVLISSIPGIVMLYFGFNLFLEHNAWYFVRDVVFTIALLMTINYTILYFMSTKLSLNGFATLLCIALFVLSGALLLTNAITQLNMVWGKIAFTLAVVSVWLKYMAELRDIK